ncbi:MULTISPECIES: hypothetical protein [Acidiplasma]|uniref:Uncharacterized protein n=1 Tax=Acidiplasma aeolicum TaxID=507754 RepID=A0A0P9GP55_9ARCH|nr:MULTISPECIES: hypothetical protein [Acidiplasma]KJE48572.1 hypothetical protein TZ01_07875 [Acidiplasma sp. MBA-1]KPV42380.1 hypothetical protein SE19_09215 [Acidiplasma aeolicum]WMT55310.1 MAG: hypothetical protein RE470_01380 [Acidiplasma sp.]
MIEIEYCGGRSVKRRMEAIMAAPRINFCPVLNNKEADYIRKAWDKDAWPDGTKWERIWGTT